MGVLQIFVSSILGVVLEDERLEVFLFLLNPLLLRARGTRIDHTNEREHLRLVTRLRIWGRSSESFAREWDRGGRARLVTRAFDTWPGARRLLA